MNIHLIVWWKVKVLVCQGVSAISPTPILPTYYHSEVGPYHSESVSSLTFIDPSSLICISVQTRYNIIVCLE